MSIPRVYSAWQEINGIHYIQWLGWNAEVIKEKIGSRWANHHSHGAVFTSGAGCGWGWKELPLYDYIVVYEEHGLEVVGKMTAGQFRVTYPVR